MRNYNEMKSIVADIVETYKVSMSDLYVFNIVESEIDFYECDNEVEVSDENRDEVLKEAIDLYYSICEYDESEFCRSIDKFLDKIYETYNKEEEE